MQNSNEPNQVQWQKLVAILMLRLGVRQAEISREDIAIAEYADITVRTHLGWITVTLASKAETMHSTEGGEA